MEQKNHKAGYANILGLPNVGKSTLMNALIGEKISIVSKKVQTTRHRILGILTEENYQIVFSDTPGILEPKYLLHETMMSAVYEALDDADILLYMVDAGRSGDKEKQFLEKILRSETPVYLLLNKIDKLSQELVVQKMRYWGKVIDEERIIPLSALHGFNLQKIKDIILDHLPEHPPYFPPNQITDRSERFIASEMVREKLFHHFHQEIPYSVEVDILEFIEEEELLRVNAEIIVNRKTQKPILIGKGGEALKKIGTAARKDMEDFFKKKVFLQLYVKIREDWRNKTIFLKSFGYK